MRLLFSQITNFYELKCLNLSFKLTTDPISNTEAEHDDDDRDLHQRHDDPDVDGVAVGKHLHDSHPVAAEMLRTILVYGQRKCHERNFHSGANFLKLKRPKKKKTIYFNRWMTHFISIIYFIIVVNNTLYSRGFSCQVLRSITFTSQMSETVGP